ncbi:MAG: VCBS repeat-containing protein, partial [Candidatus Gracilibacteria bacterium]|nr:VCBS repeat-containing protein [Candidatus Gracilibacteria bacterium]
MTVLPSKEKLKKWLSSFLIFVIFALQTFQIPFSVTELYASTSEAPNLVSIIVSEATNSGEVKTKIKRYADDIQAAMNNTRVVIVEVADNIAPHSIAALNEKLFYEGDGKGIARLVGTVLIGKLPLPVVHNGSKTFLSIYPYTDFDEKVFLFDTEKGYYEASSSPIENDSPEVWHGVIQPNTGDTAQDRQKLVEYLDKNHDFYTKQGVFANMSQEPYVFYLDVTHDQKAASAANWKSYNLGLEYLEDISYNRFNKHLAKTLYDKFQGFQDATEDVNPDELAELGIVVPKIDAMDFSSSPDVQTRTAITKVTKQFFEIFNEKYLGDILKYIYNTGRYGDGTNTRADIAPVLISKRDEFMKRVIKDTNTVLEDSIDQLVKNGLSRDIAIPTSVKVTKTDNRYTSTSQAEDPLNPFAPRANGRSKTNTATDNDPPIYYNYYFGKAASTITSARECSIVRGSTLPVEANRGYNILNVEPDLKKLTPYTAECFPAGKPATGDFWGGNSPLNIKTTTGSIMQLNGNRYENYILPTFDLLGQKEITPSATLPIYSPDSCLAENYIADPYVGKVDDEMRSQSSFYHPARTSGTQFFCIMRDSNGAVGHKNFINTNPTRFVDALANRIAPPACTVVKVNLIGGTNKTFGSLCQENTSSSSGIGVDAISTSTTGDYGTIEEYEYKKIPSWITHKSPTDEEFGSAVKGMTTPSLASDVDRYIDFYGPKGTVQKIVYPNFFRLSSQTFEGTGSTTATGGTFLDDLNATIENAYNNTAGTSTAPTVEQNLTIDLVKAKIKSVLDAKSAEINALITSQNPATLSGDQLLLYQTLKNGTYPEANVDLYQLLESNGNVLSTLADTLFWYNKSNATSKYSFILENYLDRDGNRDYPLIGQHKDYEMAYIGGPGDAQNMYVKLDPESKGNLPKSITDIQAEYGSLTNLLDGANISAYAPEDSKFKCGPPEGVPIWQWLPAVFCWLGTILPPTIEAGKCGPPLGGDKKNDSDHFTSPTGADGKPNWQKDTNKNGILDGYEWIKDGEIKLTTPLKRIGYRADTSLVADLTKDGRSLAFDSYNEVAFDIKKIVLKKGQAQVDGSVVTSDKIVYVRNGSGDAGSLETLKKYVFFTPIKVRAESGTAKYNIQSIDRDIDITIEATVSPKDKNGAPAFTKVSNELLLEVRSEALKVNSLVKTGTESQTNPTFKAGLGDNITFSFSVTGSNPEAPSPAKYPVKVKILDDIDETVLQDTQNISSDNYIYAGDLLKKAGNYRVEFIDAENRFGTVVVNVLPADPVRIDTLPSSSLFVKGQKDMILVRAMDAFGNITKGDLLQIKGTVTGGGYFTDNNANELTKNTVEGYLGFEISANDGNQTQTLNFSTTDSTGNTINSTPLTIKSIDYAKIRVNIPGRSTIVAGGTETDVNLEVVDADGQVLTGFNGVASIDFPKNSGKFSTSFIQIENGKNKVAVKFTPGSVAVIDGKIDVQIPGIQDIENGTLSVLPSVPMRVGLQTDTSKMEAKVGKSATVTAQLFDRYGNLAYNHPTGMTAKFSIPSGYGKYGSIAGGDVPFTNGVARAQVNASSNPGTLYFTVEATPGLESNSFTISDASGAALVIKGYSKNVSFIESYYLWNAEKLQNTNYNVLSTTLIGADYGNVVVPNYLAGELIFNTASSSMAVTTLLNSAEQKSEIVQMTPGGKLIMPASNLAEIQVGSNKNRTTLDIFDPFKRENIGRIYLNTRSDTPLFACETSTADDLNACDIGGKDAYMVLKGMDSATTTRTGNKLTLSFGSVPVFEISADGTIKKYPTVVIEADGTESKNLLSLSIRNGSTQIGRLGIKWNASQILMSAPDSLDSTLAANPGTMVYEGISPRYGIEYNHLGNSSYGAKGIKIFSQTEATQVDRALMGSSGKQGFEEYSTQKGIGFGDGNNTQLEFASQASLGEATISYATYSQIVIGDPVVRLSEILSPQSYDRTLGKKLTTGKGGMIESYSPFDYNNDGMEDIAVFYTDGKVELLQNYKGVYKSLGYLLYVVDAGKERKTAADFNGDGFGDIIMVNKSGKLIIIENNNGRFVRSPLKIINESGADAAINGNIMQLEMFDMDRDGKMDLVISDDSGELNILYGGGTDGHIIFTKKTLDGDIGLKIGTGALNTGGAVRFAGIKEVSPVTQTDYASETATAGDGETLSLADQIRLLDSKIYYQQRTTRQIPTQDQAQSTRLLGAIGDDPENPGVPNQALAEQISTVIQETQNQAAS